MIILLSKHTKEMMVERGVTKEQIKIAIQRGSRVRQTEGYLTSYGYIRVAYKKRGNMYKVKTVYVE